MNTTSLTAADQTALALAMTYWAAHWDFECPTLFGIELGQFQSVIASWPTVQAGSEHATSLALLGSMRELLYGASAVPRSELPPLIGMSYQQAHDLCSQVHAFVQPFVE
jgi:hypothetical protein